MISNKNDINKPNQAPNDLKTQYDTMSQIDKMGLIDLITKKMDQDPELSNYFVNKLIENVGYVKTMNILDKYNKKEDNNEPILNEDIRKFTAFPIQYQTIWKKYKEQMACFWKAEEIDFSNDYNDFMTLSDNEKYFIEMILAFFAASDGIVNFNLSERFIKEVQNTEIIFAYQFQAMMENIHCVSGNTKILTDQGYKKIVDLLFENVKVWNGKEFSEVLIQYTGDSQLYRVELTNGMYLDCTPEHKWFTKTRNQSEKSITFTKDLKINDIIYDYSLPIVDNQDPDRFVDPYSRGVQCGNIESFSTNIDKERYFVPINYSKETKLRWFEGVCDSCGCPNYNTHIKITNDNRKFFKKIQLMLTTLGIHSELSFNSDLNRYMIDIDSYNTKLLSDLGLKPKIYQLICGSNKQSNPKKISKITLLDGIHKTYCFNESKEHSGIFNGILTGQSEVYSLMLENIVKDVERRFFLFDAIRNVESVKMMADWAFKWIESSKSFAYRVVAFAIVEGVFFSGAFAAIFWIKKYKNKNRKFGKGKPFMDGLIKSNKFISRDEGLHCKFACEIYSLLKNKLLPSEMNEIMKEGVIISQRFMTDALPVSLIGMNSTAMCDYIEYIGDRLLFLLGYNKIFNKKNPFKFMETIGLNDKTNFFETRPHEYQDAHIMNKTTKGSFKISDNNDDW